MTHPFKEKSNVRCWGLQKAVDFEMVSNPFVISRDNTGYVLINVKTMKAYQLLISPISANLFGHGDILRVFKSENGHMRILTII